MSNAALAQTPPVLQASSPTLLIVDDEATMRRAVRRTLDDEGYRLIEAASGAEALEILAKQSVHVVVSDHDMPGMTGLDLLRMIRLKHPTLVRIMLTASSDLDVAVRAINLGEVSRFIRKPWRDDELVCSVRQAFDQAAVERELRKLRRQARRTLDQLHMLEESHPGITKLRRNRAGAIVIDEDLDANGALDVEAIWRD